MEVGDFLNPFTVNQEIIKNEKQNHKTWFQGCKMSTIERFQQDSSLQCVSHEDENVKTVNYLNNTRSSSLRGQRSKVRSVSGCRFLLFPTHSYCIIKIFTAVLCPPGQETKRRYFN